jgi:hypothetical protein
MYEAHFGLVLLCLDDDTDFAGFERPYERLEFLTSRCRDGETRLQFTS